MPVQTSFNSGELSPQIYGRPDLAKYANGCRTLRNMICLSHGPATRRSGTVFVSAVKDHSKKVKLVDYKFSVEQAYIFEFGEDYIRYHMDGWKIVEKTMVITGATQANPVVITFTGDTPVNGEVGTINGVQGMVELNSVDQYTVANVSGSTFELSGVDGTAFTAYTSGGTVEKYYETTTTYTEAELEDLDFASSFDTIYIAQPEHPQHTLVRSGHTDWAFAEWTHCAGPFTPENDTDTTLDPSGVDGSISIAASADVFAATDISRIVAINYSGSWGIARITAFTDARNVDAEVEVKFGAATAQTAWKLGIWSGTAKWPRAVSFYNDRLWWAGSPGYPQTLWGSSIGLYTCHLISDPVVDDDALSLTLGSKEANAIQWLSSGSKFAVGTTGTEHWLTSASGSGAITPTSKAAPVGSHDGCSKVKPVMAANAMLFLMTHKKILKELKYSYEADSFKGDELTTIAEHLTRNNTIIDMAFQREPYRVIWCVRDDGKLLGLTYYPEHEVYGWHVHELGGDGAAESVSVIPGDNEDEVWLAVKRTIDGSTKRYIEKLHETFKGVDTTDAFFVDSGLTLDNRQDIDSITHADPGVINLVAHGYTDGDSITIRSIDAEITGEEDLLSLNNERFEVAHKATDTFQLHDIDDEDVDLTAYKQVVSATVAENVTVISGLHHLEAESVAILVDGAPHPEKTVSDGSITLDSSASVIHVGLGFESELETFPPERIDPKSQELGEIRRITNVIVQLYKTLGMKISNSSKSWTYDYEFSSDNVPHGQPAPLFDGFTDDISFDDGQSREPTVVITQDEPLPMTVLAIHQTVESEDD
ncbi:hypothetical protein KAR91_11940 [Candidatus Pacearchaeota archaeon]|nr:hypothetical protein [Candidatus Pacearchaeota archaeon]